MAISIDDYREIQLQARALKNSDGAEAAISHIRSVLEQVAERELRYLLLEELALYFLMANKPDDAGSAFRQATEEWPENPLPWCALASHYHRTNKELRRASAAIETALGKASAQGCLVRHVLAQRIDIALDSGNYALVEDSLALILDAPTGPDVKDVRLEDYFLERIPDGKVDGNLLDRYRKAVNSARNRAGRD